MECSNVVSRNSVEATHRNYDGVLLKRKALRFWLVSAHLEDRAAFYNI